MGKGENVGNQHFLLSHNVFIRPLSQGLWGCVVELKHIETKYIMAPMTD